MRWMTGRTSRLAQAVATAAVLTTAPLITQATAQIDMRTGLHLDDRDPNALYRERRQGQDAAVNVAPEGRAQPPRVKRRPTKK
jgi:hypothetical protein